MTLFQKLPNIIKKLGIKNWLVRERKALLGKRYIQLDQNNNLCEKMCIKKDRRQKDTAHR